MPDGRRPSLWPRLVGAAQTALDRAADGVEALADGLRSLGRGRAPAPPVDARLTGVDPAIAAYVSAREPEWFSLQVPDDAQAAAWPDPAAGGVWDAGTDAGAEDAAEDAVDGSGSGSDERDHDRTSRPPSRGDDPARVFFPEQAPRAGQAIPPPTERFPERRAPAQERSGESAQQRGGKSDRPAAADAPFRVDFGAGSVPRLDDAAASRAALPGSRAEPGRTMCSGLSMQVIRSPVSSTMNATRSITGSAARRRARPCGMPRPTPALRRLRPAAGRPEQQAGPATERCPRGQAGKRSAPTARASGEGTDGCRATACERRSGRGRGMARVRHRVPRRRPDVAEPPAGASTGCRRHPGSAHGQRTGETGPRAWKRGHETKAASPAPAPPCAAAAASGRGRVRQAAS